MGKNAHGDLLPAFPTVHAIHFPTENSILAHSIVVNMVNFLFFFPMNIGRKLQRFQDAPPSLEMWGRPGLQGKPF